MEIELVRRKKKCLIGFSCARGMTKVLLSKRNFIALLLQEVAGFMLSIVKDLSVVNVPSVASSLPPSLPLFDILYVCWIN